MSANLARDDISNLVVKVVVKRFLICRLMDFLVVRNLVVKTVIKVVSDVRVGRHGGGARRNQVPARAYYSLLVTRLPVGIARGYRLRDTMLTSPAPYMQSLV